MQASANMKGMEAEVYEAAVRGTFEAMSRICNWKEQRTPTKNNVLHLHVGKPLVKKKAKKLERWDPRVYIEFIRKVVDDDEKGYMLMLECNSNGDTPLHLAAGFGHTDAVKAFLERAERVSHEEVTRLLKVRNKNKDTALHQAARAGYGPVVKILVEADPNCPHHEPNEDSETPLYLAAESGCHSSVVSILDTCNASALAYNCNGPCGRTALHAAVLWGNSVMVTKILEKDTSLLKIQDEEGLTALHCAVAVNKLKILKMLLSFEKKEEFSVVYIQDNMGRTALHIAMLLKNWNAMRNLVDTRPDCVEIVDNNGQNVLHYGARFTCNEVMESLMALGYLDKFINNKDVDGNTPFHILVASVAHSSKLHYCLNKLPNLVKNNPFLDFKAFNKQNFTVGDILFSVGNLLHQERILVGHKIQSGMRINNFERIIEANKVDPSMGELNVKTIKGAAEYRLVVAALIATVSFTAGFTVPGGLDQNSGETLGMAVFRSKASFKLFLISDAIAFTSSTLAILCYFVLVSTEAKWAIQSLSIGGLTLNTISLGALMIAFLAGVFAISSNPLGLVIAVSATFFLCYFSLVVRNLQTLSFIWNNMTVKDLLEILCKTTSNASQ